MTIRSYRGGSRLAAVVLFIVFLSRVHSALGATPQIGMYTTVCDSEDKTAELIARCKAAGVSTLYPSLCGSDSVLWKTEKETYYRSMQAKLDAGYDGLEVMIRLAHQAGLKVYPSVVCGPGGSVTRLHPEWETRDRRGRPSSATTGAYIAFSIPEARAAKIAILMDLVRGYDIDGLFIDECNSRLAPVLSRATED